MQSSTYIYYGTHVSCKHDFTFSPSCDISSVHTHNLFEIIYIVSGDATHVIEDKKYKLKPGDLVLVRPKRYHFIKIDSPADYERYDFTFDEERVGINTSEILGEDVDVINLAESRVTTRILKNMDYYRQHLSDKEFEDVTISLIKELLYTAAVEKRGVNINESVILNPLLTKAISYINQNLAKIKSISEIADALFVTESYLFRMFKRELRQTPKKYITDKRLLNAETMLNQGKRPTEVATACGFGDYATFFRCYKKFFGAPPSAKPTQANSNAF